MDNDLLRSKARKIIEEERTREDKAIKKEYYVK